MKRNCQECGGHLMGRIDQKFCSDHCRNTHNNKINKDETAYMRNVSRQLKRNRRILKVLNPNGKTKVKKHTLLSNGFNFRYFTNVFKNKEGKVYYFCFEYGFMPLDNDVFALVINRDMQADRKGNVVRIGDWVYSLAVFGIDWDVIQLKELSSDWAGSSSVPIYLGLMAIAGAILLASDTKKKQVFTALPFSMI